MTDSTFKLDTSGEVLHPAMLDPRAGDAWLTISWDDLSPFAQGFVEAAVQAIEWPDPAEGYGPSSRVIRFDSIAPAFLARVIRDCEVLSRRSWNTEDDVSAGRVAFQARHRGRVTYIGFPPLRIFLNTAGQVDGEDA